MKISMSLGQIHWIQNDGVDRLKTNIYYLEEELLNVEPQVPGQIPLHKG